MERYPPGCSSVSVACCPPVRLHTREHQFPIFGPECIPYGSPEPILAGSPTSWWHWPTLTTRRIMHCGGDVNSCLLRYDAHARATTWPSRKPRSQWLCPPICKKEGRTIHKIRLLAAAIWSCKLDKANGLGCSNGQHNSSRDDFPLSWIQRYNHP